MDSFSSQREDGYFLGMSESLVSYGSDLEASVDESIPNLKHDPSKTLTENDSATSNKTLCNSLSELVQQLSVTGLSAKKQKEFEEVLGDVTAAQKEYLETMEVFRALKNVIGPDSKLPVSVIETVQKILLKEDLKGYIVVEKNYDAGVLGLKEEHLFADCPQQLLEIDQKVLQLAVESEIIQTARELKQCDAEKQEALSKLMGRDPDSGNCIEGEHTVQLVSLRAELNKELSNYYKQLVRLDSLLESIVQLRTDEMNAECLKTIEGLKMKAQAMKQRAQLASAQMSWAFYTEDEQIPAALQCLQRELDQLHSETQAEHMRLTALRAAYERVEGQQFEKILEEYRAVRKQLKLIKYSLDSMMCN